MNNWEERQYNLPMGDTNREPWIRVPPVVLPHDLYVEKPVAITKVKKCKLLLINIRQK